MIFAALVLAATADAVPRDVQPFVEKQTTVLAVERGDLNRDGREDAIVVLEPRDPEQSRPLLILVRDEKGALRLAKRSAKIVGCSVPDAAGNASLRIVHLSGIGSL